MASYSWPISRESSGGGILSINSDTSSAQVIAGSNNISVSTSGGTTTVNGSLLAPKSSPSFSGGLSVVGTGGDILSVTNDPVIFLGTVIANTRDVLNNNWMSIIGADSATNGQDAGGMYLQGGFATVGSANGGDVQLFAGDGHGSGNGGQCLFVGGSSDSGTGGGFILRGGSSTSGTSGGVAIQLVGTVPGIFKITDEVNATILSVTHLGVLNLPALTASKIVLTDASKNLISSSLGASDILTQTVFAEGNLGTLTWAAGVAPSGSITKKYRANQHGNVVYVQFNIQASIAGTAVTSVSFPLPVALPTPTYFAETAVSDFDISGSGTLLSDITAGPTTGPTIAFLGKDGSGNPIVKIYGPSVAAVAAVASFTYFTN